MAFWHANCSTVLKRKVPKREMLNWYATYVKSRHEFIAFEELKRKGISAFLPAVTKMRQWKDRKKAVSFPLFPGYLFVNVKPLAADFLGVLKTRGVVSLISSESGVPSAIPEYEIESLRIMLESGAELDIYPGIREGADVLVRRGPFRGAQGVVVKKENQYILLVNIKILGRSVGVKVYADDLEAA